MKENIHKQGIYFLFPSIISIRSSIVALHLIWISTWCILYSCKIELIVSSDKSHSAERVIETPPLSLFLKSIWGGSLLSLIPNPSNSLSIILLWVTGLLASSTIIISPHVRATAITCLPLPLPSFAPSIIPGWHFNNILIYYFISLI